MKPNGPCVKVPSDPSPWSNRALRGCLKNQAALWCYYRFKELTLLHCHYSAGNEMVRTVHGAKQECNTRIHSRQSEERQQSSTIITFSLDAWASWAFIVHNWNTMLCTSLLAHKYFWRLFMGLVLMTTTTTSLDFTMGHLLFWDGWKEEKWDLMNNTNNSNNTRRSPQRVEDLNINGPSDNL